MISTTAGFHNALHAGSGTIDFDEFLIMMVMQISEEGKNLGEEELKEIFRLYDKYGELLNVIRIF